MTLLLKETFYGREDTELIDKLLTELPGILNWSLRGLDWLRTPSGVLKKRLTKMSAGPRWVVGKEHEEGRFTIPKSSANVINQLTDLASPRPHSCANGSNPPLTPRST